MEFRRVLDANDFKEKSVEEEALKKDNVSTEEVTNLRVINPKVKELAEIFTMVEEQMEWEKIKNQMNVEEAATMIKSLESVIKLQEKLIKEAESQEENRERDEKI
ncbi:hypothetical protein C1646_749787 [Rhizophagus diaphanus]|nr:hypothetical protein C1646_749787 [Rhizophagus diaphanus] [Rhizophagus sp. MUCL 43196]